LFLLFTYLEASLFLRNFVTLLNNAIGQQRHVG
jgi:hypothetical protein